jgi:anti-sigma factor RsiW
MAIGENDRIDLNALVDGALESARAAALQRRLETDPELRAAFDEIAATHGALARLPRPEVSEELRDRIASLVAPGGAERAHRDVGAGRWAGWRSLAASIVLSAIAASSATYLLLPHGPSFEDFAAAGHRRSLLAESPVDVASSDRHTVKPWLDAKLGVSPPAPDLAGAGYPLVGGRVDVLGQQATPTLVYRHNEHTISLAAVPRAAGTAAERQFASGGYNMIEWAAAGFSFVAVSDLEAGELATFVDLYRKAAGG